MCNNKTPFLFSPRLSSASKVLFGRLHARDEILHGLRQDGRPALAVAAGRGHRGLLAVLGRGRGLRVELRAVLGDLPQVHVVERALVLVVVEHAPDHVQLLLRELDADHPLAKRVVKNLWPEELPVIKKKGLELFDAMDHCAMSLLSAISLYLGLEEDYFPSMAKDGSNIIRVIRYPVCEGFDEPGVMRAAQHEDINLMTILPEATESGLELLTRDGEWLPIHAIEGQIIVDTGESVSESRKIMAEFRKITDKPVKAVVYTHFHPDHINGVQAFVTREQVESGDVQIYAHDTLLANVVAQGALVGPILGVRSAYSFGSFLEAQDEQDMNGGIGPLVTPEPSTFIAPTVTFADKLDTTIAGLDVQFLHVPSEAPDEIVYQLPRRTRLLASKGDSVQAGDPLHDGSLNPSELLELKGSTPTELYLVDEVQKVYRSQGVDIHDKHIELILKDFCRISNCIFC